MKAEFISITSKLKLFESLKRGDEKAIKICIHEFQRLESLIKDYEMVIDQAIYRDTQKTYKSVEDVIEKINQL